MRRSSRSRRSGRSLRPLRSGTGRALRPLRATRRPLDASDPLRPLYARTACNALWTLRPASRSLRPHRALRSLRASGWALRSGTADELHPLRGRAVEVVDVRGAVVAIPPRVTMLRVDRRRLADGELADDALVALRSLWALRADQALRTLRAGDALRALHALHALRALHPGDADLALATLQALRTYRALRSLRTLVTLRALPALIPHRPLRALETLVALKATRPRRTLHALDALIPLMPLEALRPTGRFDDDYGSGSRRRGDHHQCRYRQGGDQHRAGRGERRLDQYDVWRFLDEDDIRHRRQ